MTTVPSDGTSLRHRLIAAKMGWGRLPDINLASAYVVEALRVSVSASVVGVNRKCQELASIHRTPVFDLHCWETRLRLEDLAEQNLVSESNDIWSLMPRTITHVYGDSKMKPLYNSRSVRDIPEHRIIQGGASDCASDD